MSRTLIFSLERQKCKVKESICKSICNADAAFTILERGIYHPLGFDVISFVTRLYNSTQLTYTQLSAVPFSLNIPHSFSFPAHKCLTIKCEPPSHCDCSSGFDLLNTPHQRDHRCYKSVHLDNRQLAAQDNKTRYTTDLYSRDRRT